MRITAFVLVFVLIVCVAPVQADASVVYSEVPDNAVNILTDFVSHDVQNNIATDTYLLDSAQSTENDLQYLFSSGWSSSSELTSSAKDFDIGFGSSGPYYGLTVDYYPSHYCLFSLDGLPALDWSTFALIYDYYYGISKSANSPASPEITIEYRMTCYDSDRSEITDYPLDIVYSAVAGNSGLVTSTPIVFTPPDGTMYILPYIRFIVPYTLSLNRFILYGTSSYTLQQTYSLDGPGDSGGGGDGGGDTGGTTPTIDTELGDKLDGVQDAIDSLPDKEQHAADNQGNSSIDGVLDVVPDHSQGFMDAIGLLAGAMAYDGVDAVLTTPAVKFPALSGVVSSFELMPSYDIDFGWWVQQLPDGILTLIQCLLTIALVVYCFRELYGTISYLFTLRGGSD